MHCLVEKNRVKNSQATQQLHIILGKIKETFSEQKIKKKSLQIYSVTSALQ